MDEEGRGVNIEIDANNNTGVILSLDSDGIWEASVDVFFYEIGEVPPLNDVLRYSALLGDNFPKLVRKWKEKDRLLEMASNYVKRNRRSLAENLFSSMQGLIDDSEYVIRIGKEQS